jgi:hypothetical protein
MSATILNLITYGLLFVLIILTGFGLLWFTLWYKDRPNKDVRHGIKFINTKFKDLGFRQTIYEFVDKVEGGICFSHENIKCTYKIEKTISEILSEPSNRYHDRRLDFVEGMAQVIRLEVKHRTDDINQMEGGGWYFDYNDLTFKDSLTDREIKAQPLH